MTYITQLTGRTSRLRLQIMAFVAFGMLLLQTNSVHAQWTTPDVNQNINNTNTGNVGIGAPSPGSPLFVTGNEPSWDFATLRVKPTVTHGGIVIDSANNTSQAHLRFFKSGVPKWQFRVPFQDGVEDFRLYSWAASTDVLNITPAGNVGIGTGTTSPGAKLEVDGSGMLRVTEGSRTVPTSGVGLELSADSNGSYVGAYNRSTSAYRRLYFYGSPYIFESGNVGIGTTNPSQKLDIVGNINVTGTGTGNINASGTITGGTIIAKYQDVAEWVESSESLAAGTVVVLDHTKSNQVVASSQAYDTRVAGVISLQPGITLGESGAGKVLVATTGRVKIKVDATAGPIQIGDLLVTSDKSGVAKKSEPLSLGGVRIHRPGTLIGKALEPLAKGTGEILVLLSLQ